MAVETFLTHYGWFVGAGVSEYQDMLQPIDTLAECKAVWAKASPAERAGCLEFIKANSKRRMGDSGKTERDTPRTASTSGGNPLGVGGAWGFVRCTNLDTGRKFLAAALWLDNKGLTLNQIRGVVGLPRVKGGDIVAIGPPAISLGKVVKGGLLPKPKPAMGMTAKPKLMSREQAKRLGLLNTKPVKGLAKPKRRYER